MFEGGCTVHTQESLALQEGRCTKGKQTFNGRLIGDIRKIQEAQGVVQLVDL